MLDNVKQELERFKDKVIAESKKELARQGKKSSGRLFNSIDGELEVYKTNNFWLSFTLGDYGEFVDKGVSGTRKKYKTPFSYTTKMPPPSKLDKWIVRKGMGKDEKGRFVSRKSLQFLIARSIFRNGLKPSLFFTKPFNKEFKKVSDDIVEAFGLEIDDFLAYTLNKL
jgi:hypothetical protein